MMNQYRRPSLLIAILGAAALGVSCSSPARVADVVPEETAIGTPHVVTVLQTEGCINTASAVALVESYATELGLDIQVDHVVVRTNEDVQKYRFLGSPTVRINGLDVQRSARANTRYGFT